MAEVKRYTKDNAPRVRLRSNANVIGWMIEEGETQSLVRWPNGNEDCVVNTWVERVEGPLLLRPVDHPVMKAPQPKSVVESVVDTMREAERTPKVRREPDELALRVAKFDDAALKAFAVANHVWQDKYAELPNNGLRRMNILNRIRTKIKLDPTYKVVW